MLNKTKIIAIFAALLPAAAFADISGTLTIAANTRVSMDTGTTVSSGGDFLWSGSVLTPEGSAIALNVTAFLATVSGATGYANVTQALLSAFASDGSSAPISGLAAGNVVGYMTNGGNLGKFLVTAVNGTSLAIQYTTYISVTPTITSVLNNYSYVAAGLPNYGIAPGTLFVIKGANLASTTTVSALQDPATGIPASLNGASVSVTVGGVTTTPGIYYAIATQIAAVLPSNTPVGTGTVTVSYSGASATADITVVSSALGLDTYYGTGSGLGVATNASSGALYNYTNSIPPGTLVVLWGSGLGATSDSDTTKTSTPHPVSNFPTFYVGGIAVTPLYAGRSVYPGVDQVNLTIPATAPTGCGVSVVAVSGSIVSNSIALPIGTGVCSDPLLGVDGTQLTNQTTSTNGYTSGTLELLQLTTTGLEGQEQTNASANFYSYPPVTVSAAGIPSVNSLGSCSVSTSSLTSNSTGPTINLGTGLDAGTITITGAAGTQTLNNQSNPTGTGPSGMYVDLLANSFFGTGGTFTFTGTGGQNVGAFSATVAYANPLSWTNSSSITTVNRAIGQSVTWTGGASNSYVFINGGSSSSTASSSFTCYAPATAGQFTIPSYVLLALPATSGHMGVTNLTTPAPFSASGLTQGAALAGVSFSIGVTYN